MTVRQPMTAIFIFSVLYFCSACEVSDMAVYKVKLKMLWSENIFPKDYDAKPQWSSVFGQSHNKTYSLYRVGEESRPLVNDFLEYGNTDPLIQEGEEDPKVYDQFTATAVESGVGETETVVFLDGGHSLISLMCRMIPSANWFIGVDSLDLCLHSSWVEQVTLDLDPLDSGIGISHDVKSKPVEKVSYRNWNIGGHYFYRNPRQLHTIAKVEFTKIKEYSTKELNDLARKEIFNEAKENIKQNDFLKENYRNYKAKEEITTKSSFEQLKELEEDPVGTPRPNVPENNVVVVTKAPFFKETEEEIESHLESMDDVVLAVANGRKLGLGKHLPRHFRSRLHHAVNKKHTRKPESTRSNIGKDCIVSEWSNWSRCTDPCAEKTRVRTVVREKKGDGRDCPSLIEKQFCGKCVRGDGDYVW